MRYAVYFTPAPATPLAGTGARFLGRDAFTGAALAQPTVEGLAADRLAALTADPRRYGFHATLKPPFRLAPGTTEAGLRDALERFAAGTRPVAAPLAVSRLAGFVALTPSAPNEALDELAATVVRAFEPFRAPLDPSDLARRRAGGLSERQDRYLVDWGYPHVFEEFRFHMTLSERLSGEEADLVQAAAERIFAPLLTDPVPVDTLGLFVEPAPGAPFTVLATARLSAQ